MCKWDIEEGMLCVSRREEGLLFFKCKWGVVLGEGRGCFVEAGEGEGAALQ